jgi:thiosulfate/3-mercaptopyruvate sulfurtransferase
MNAFPMVVLVTALIAPGAGLTEPPPRLALATFDELQGRLNEAELRLLDARPREQYANDHIPGAVWVDPKAVEALAARLGALTDRAAWESWIEPLGIGLNTRVLIYDARRQLDAARLWWLLSYLGVERVGLIDGGFSLWKNQGRPVTTEVPRVALQAFKVHFQTDRLATRSDVVDALKGGNARVIDARSQAEHTGVEKRSMRAGRIPTACHLEWTQLVDADGRFLEEAALRARLATAGVKPGEPVITHCQGGGRASVDAFVFERLGFPTRNYYLGWSDWGEAEDTPIETGPAAKPGPR